MSLHRVAAGMFGRLPYPVRRAALHRLGRYAPWEEQFDLSPPDLGAGETAGPPDFVGIGVQKAGTTWWYSLIATHPDVWSRPDIHKERHYLSRYQFGLDAFGPDDIRRYHGWFPRRAGTVSGEFTPDYLSSPLVPSLLAAAAPDTRLLVILRDPVERFVSGVGHQLRFGASRTTATMTEAVERGFYSQALHRWTQHFDADQLLILQYERCRRAPAEELARTYRHLGLDDGFRPGDLTGRVSSSAADPIPLAPEARERLVDVYTPEVTSLQRDVPGLDLSLWPNFAHLSTA